jgi:hypothetical protein
MRKGSRIGRPHTVSRQCGVLRAVYEAPNPKFQGDSDYSGETL